MLQLGKYASQHDLGVNLLIWMSWVEVQYKHDSQRFSLTGMMRCTTVNYTIIWISYILCYVYYIIVLVLYTIQYMYIMFF